MRKSIIAAIALIMLGACANATPTVPAGDNCTAQITALHQAKVTCK